ncbi:MAG: helix-turn-helix domain-containing protein [Victivallales bacterium]|nr:helix-turn-helix domain-containing protein [Victivallales bacterium]
MEHLWNAVEPFSTTEYDYAFPEKGFPLSVMRFSSFVPINLHRHDFHELVLVTGGRARHDLGDFSYFLQARDVFLIAPDQFHGYSDCENFSYYNALVDFRALKLPLFDLKSQPGWQRLKRVTRSPRKGEEHVNCSLAPTIYNQCCECLERILSLQAARPAGYHFAILAYFVNLLMLVCDASGMQEDSPLADAGVASPQLSDFIRCFAGNPGMPLSIESLASQSGVSRSTVFREFQRHCGMTPAKYQMRCRLRNAASLLLHSSANTETIAKQCGFKTAAHFATVFRREYGMSPTQFRVKSKA